MQTDNIFAQLISQHCGIILPPWCNIFYLHIILLPWCNIFYLDIILLPWCNIFYLNIILLPWCNIFYLDIILLPWCNIFFLDIILLPWCNIFCLDIILLPWCNIFYLDIISLPSAVIQHFLPWYHFTAVIENFLLWYNFTAVIRHFEVKGSNPVQAWIFFRLSFRNCKSCVYNYDDLPSYSKNIVKLLAISQTIHTVCCEDDYFPKGKFKPFNSLFHSEYPVFPKRLSSFPNLFAVRFLWDVCNEGKCCGGCDRAHGKTFASLGLFTFARIACLLQLWIKKANSIISLFWGTLK